MALGIGLTVIVLAWHLNDRVLPTIGQPISQLSLSRSTPYLVLLASICFLYWLKKQRKKSYQEFISNSPGIKVDTNGINYGVGHGHKSTD